MLNKTTPKKRESRQAGIVPRGGNTAECLREKQPGESLHKLKRALRRARGAGRKKVREEGDRESPCPAQCWSTYFCWSLGGHRGRGRSGLVVKDAAFVGGADHCGPPRHTPAGRNVRRAYNEPL